MSRLVSGFVSGSRFVRVLVRVRFVSGSCLFRVRFVFGLVSGFRLVRVRFMSVSCSVRVWVGV